MDKIIFTKYSNDRGTNFKIRTDICLDDKGNRYVKKHALTEEAKNHVQHISNAYEKLQSVYGDVVDINECSIDKNGDVRFAYISGHTLNEELNNTCKKSNKHGVLEIVDRYKNLVFYNAEEEFEITDEFINVFGKVDLPKGLKSTRVADIDLIFENILVDGIQWNIIDYEWTFMFPVPVNFILYRALSAFIEGLYSGSDKHLSDLNLYEYCGITQTEITEYKKMINGFENYVMQGGDTMKTLHGKIAQGLYKPQIASEIVYSNLNKMGIQIFPDYGNGYDENKSFFIEPTIDCFGKSELIIDIEKGCCGYRIDPAMSSCILSISKIEVDGETKMYSSNGIEFGNNAIVFDTDDAQLYIENLENNKKLNLCFRVTLIDKICTTEINNYAKDRIKELENKNLEIQQSMDRFIEINKIAEERNNQINEINKMAEEQNVKVADLYKQLENLYIEKNEIEKKYAMQVAELTRENQVLNVKIEDMKNTKVWKMYSKYQNLRYKNKS